MRIDLIVRGACCLLPGVAGLSENIHVVSIIDRFLEHSRIMLFRNGGNTEVYVSSGDWMPRTSSAASSSRSRSSTAVEGANRGQILATALSDNVKGWRLHPDGTYKRREGGKVRSQERFIEIARTEAAGIGSYEESLKTPSRTRRKAKKPKKKDRPGR